MKPETEEKVAIYDALYYVAMAKCGKCGKREQADTSGDVYAIRLTAGLHEQGWRWVKGYGNVCGECNSK